MTLLTKRVWTRQELFETAVRGLYFQGWKKSITGFRCMYRDADGNKCAIGQCIPDDEYHPQMEKALLQNIIQLRGPDPVPFMDGLQRCHDRANILCDEGMGALTMPEMFMVFGRTFKLTWPKLPTPVGGLPKRA